MNAKRIDYDRLRMMMRITPFHYRRIYDCWLERKPEYVGWRTGRKWWLFQACHAYFRARNNLLERLPSMRPNTNEARGELAKRRWRLQGR